MARSRLPWITALLLCAAGLAAALKLALIHRQVHEDPSVASFCALSDSVNCDTVALSPYSVFLGAPVAVWGLVGYALLAAVIVRAWLARHRHTPLAIFTALSTVTVGVSAVLATISALFIESLCILCFSTYLINGLLLGLSVMLWRRECSGLGVRAALQQLRRKSRPIGLLGAAAGIAGALLSWCFPKYWISAAQASTTAPPPSVTQEASDCPAQAAFATGVTDDGHPWIGAREPGLLVVEFSDYQCPFCSRAHREIRTYVRAHPETIRLVHRHFPLDQACNPSITRPFHPHACFYAKLAICAQQQDKFWAANDYLYTRGRDPTRVTAEELAQELGLELAELSECLQQRASGPLNQDLQEGLRLQLRGTPTFLVDGELHMGRVPPEILLDAVSSAPRNETSGPSHGS